MGSQGSGGLRVGTVVGAIALAFLLGTAACSTAAPYGNTEDQVVSGKAREPAKKSGTRDPDDKSNASSMAVTKVDPPSVKAGSAPGGLSVTVTGTGFDTSSKVAIGGRAVETTFGSATSLTAMIPGEALGAAGGLPLSVVGGASRSNELSLMVYDSGSLVTAISPTSTTARTSNLSLTVSGTGFAPGAVVVFNGTDVFTTVESASAVRATVPGSLLGTAGQFNVSVKSGGGVSAPVVFTVQSGGFGSSGGSSSGGFGFCDNGGVSCMELDLEELECRSWGGTVVQCEDGCVYNGCY